MKSIITISVHNGGVDIKGNASSEDLLLVILALIKATVDTIDQDTTEVIADCLRLLSLDKTSDKFAI